MAAARKFTHVETHGNQDLVVALNELSNGAFVTKQAVNNVHDTAPSDAELQTAFGGTAASLGRGFVGTIDDNDGNAIGYIVWTSDASFYFVKGTKAT
jgi:hypothetical protein